MSYFVNFETVRLFTASGVSLNSSFDHFDPYIVGDSLIYLLLKRELSKQRLLGEPHLTDYLLVYSETSG